MADLNTKKPVKSDYRFRIGSVTKTFTATTVLQLVGENRVQLDDPIEKWLPGLVQGNGYDGNQITIRQLLNHTSGIAEYLKSKDADVMNSKNVYSRRNSENRPFSASRFLAGQRLVVFKHRICNIGNAN